MVSVSVEGPPTIHGVTFFINTGNVAFDDFTFADVVPLGHGDVNLDGIVDVNDLLAVITTWGDCPAICPADLNCDNIVDVNDLLAVITNWG